MVNDVPPVPASFEDYEKQIYREETTVLFGVERGAARRAWDASRTAALAESRAEIEELKRKNASLFRKLKEAERDRRTHPREQSDEATV